MDITSIYNNTASVAKAQRTTKSEEERLKEACEGFEAIFLHKMMQVMRSATMESGFIKKSNAEKIFTDMLDEQLSSEAAAASVNGLADMLFESLKHNIPAQREEGQTNGLAASLYSLEQGLSNGREVTTGLDFIM